MRLLDFNPIGGTTSALLFTWEELGYYMTPDPPASEPRALPAEACPADLAAQPGTNGTHSAAHVLANLREGSSEHLPSAALSHSAAGVPGSVGQQDRRASNGIGSAHMSGNGPENSAKGASEASGQQEIRRVSKGNGSAHASGHEQAEILVRFSQPGSDMLRPASALYGAPYDMADLSKGGAIADMLRRMQTQQEQGGD